MPSQHRQTASARCQDKAEPEAGQSFATEATKRDMARTQVTFNERQFDPKASPFNKTNDYGGQCGQAGQRKQSLPSSHVAKKKLVINGKAKELPMSPEPTFDVRSSLIE